MKTLLISALALTAAACGDDAQDITLNFAAKVGSENATCGTSYTNQGSGNTTIEIADFRFFVSNIELLDSDDDAHAVALDQDSSFQAESFALLDFEDASGACADSGTTETNATITGSVDDIDDVQAIRFDLGLPFAFNHVNADTADAPLNLASMQWNWQGGYKFIRIDLRNDNTAPDNQWNMHLGSTGCTSGSASEPPSEPCSKPNLPSYTLDNFSVGDTIVFDLEQLLGGVDVAANTAMTPPGCQSVPPDAGDCGDIFDNLGLSFDTGTCVGDCAGQTFLRTEQMQTFTQPYATLRVAIVLLAALCACNLETPYDWDLPVGYPTPRVPDENPMTTDKVELGRFLFYDTRLSGNESQSCGSCHEQSKAFADGLITATGSTDETLARNSQSLTNSAYSSTLTWANPILLELREQALIPMFGEFPVELGITGNEDQVLTRFATDADYIAMFAAAYPDDDEPITFANIAKALASFVRTLISSNSPYDRYVYRDDESAMSASALRGLDLFFTERLECHHCHGTFNFSSATRHSRSAFLERGFFNTGLYNIGGTGGYPLNNTGLYEITGLDADMGRFRAPTLRNIEVTGPYMHDGSIATLEEVIDFYAAGGRNIESGDFAGDGRANPYKSGFITGFTLTEQERADLLAFLRSLTDPDFLTDPRFANPFE